ncbi:MAG: hypothetical protein IPI60_04200 [Saprospiraceae bacterium]|nr:hypothetical protein [Saprospiraceae bacterium]
MDKSPQDQILEQGIVGAFTYEFIIRGPSGPSITLNGKACIVADYCEVKEENRNKCVLGTQHTGGGDFNTDLPALEGCQ